MNLSQKKRERMLSFLNKIREEHTDDISLIAINEIENELMCKKYGLIWEEHEERVDLEMKTKVPVFTEVKDNEIKEDIETNKYNFLLEGDNLHSLKLLEKTHKGKIDVIYIDPPYNLGGNDFIYDDNKVDRDDSFSHSKWLSFMKERLIIAKRLLKKTGLIMISINDREQAQLKLLCDDIFGEFNFVAELIWKSRQNKDNRNKTGVSVDHEYIICYSITPELKVFSGGERKISQYKNPDNDPRGLWVSGNMVGISTEEQRPNLHYDLVDHRTGINYGKPKMGWRYDRNTMKRLIDEDRVLFPETSEGRPRRKVFLNELSDNNTGYSSVIGDDLFTRDGTADIDNIFHRRVFSFPKPVGLIKELLTQTTETDSIVLDFFAGSGTTGHAVLELNREDGGNRKFILCTNNENDICQQVTYERLKKVITGYEFEGKKDKILYKKKISIKDLTKIDSILKEADEIIEGNKFFYDNIKKELKDGILKVIGEKKETAKIDGISANLKYFKTDFINKISEEPEYNISQALQAHIREMVQLEQGVSIDDSNYILLLSDDDADELEKNAYKLDGCKGIYVSAQVFLTSAQEKLFKDIEIKTIPDYYFESELREVGEIW